jgi:hypothetical protein
LTIAQSHTRAAAVPVDELDAGQLQGPPNRQVVGSRHRCFNIRGSARRVAHRGRRGGLFGLFCALAFAQSSSSGLKYIFCRSILFLGIFFVLCCRPSALCNLRVWASQFPISKTIACIGTVVSVPKMAKSMQTACTASLVFLENRNLGVFFGFSLGIEGVFQGLPLKINRLKGCRRYVRAWTSRYALHMGGIPQQLR